LGGRQAVLIDVCGTTKNGESFDQGQASLQELRRLIKEVGAEFPDIQAGVTGQEALNNDEMTTAMGDMTRATWLSLVGISVLLVVFLCGLRRPMIELAALAVGMCWTVGWTTFSSAISIFSPWFSPRCCADLGWITGFTGLPV